VKGPGRERILTVEGEQFRVRRRRRTWMVLEYDDGWLTGPHPGDGASRARSGPARVSTARGSGSSSPRSAAPGRPRPRHCLTRSPRPAVRRAW